MHLRGGNKIENQKTKAIKEWNYLAIFTIICLIFSYTTSNMITDDYDELENDIDTAFNEAHYYFEKSEILSNRFETLMNQRNIYEIQLYQTNDSIEQYVLNYHINSTSDDIDDVLTEKEYVIQNLSRIYHYLLDKEHQLNQTMYVQVLNFAIKPFFQILLPVTTLFLGLINGGNPDYILFGKKSLILLFIITSILYLIILILFNITNFVLYDINHAYSVFLLTLLLIPIIITFYLRRRTIKAEDGVRFNFVIPPTYETNADCPPDAPKGGEKDVPPKDEIVRNP